MTVSDTLIYRQPSLVRQVHDALNESIATGKFESGERIVVEHVAEQLHVSPTPVREALNRLVQEGLVRETGKGRLQVVDLTPSYVLDTFLVRSALEGLAAELAASHITDTQVHELHAEMTEVDAALAKGDYDAYLKADSHLHRTVQDAANNAVLSRKLQALRTHIDYIRVYSRRHAGEHIRRSHAEHQRIAETLSSRNAQASRQAMEQHIRQAGERIAELIDFQGECPPLVEKLRQGRSALAREHWTEREKCISF